ncbi:MAG: hypothetical protein IPF54_10755 [Draconibacterium sp.]|nr:hypothetical protein [Draconibacterium sp.]
MTLQLATPSFESQLPGVRWCSVLRGVLGGRSGSWNRFLLQVLTLMLLMVCLYLQVVGGMHLQCNGRINPFGRWKY